MSIDFNSIDGDGINCGDGSSVQDVSPLSACAWIYPTGWGGLTFGRVICKEGVVGPDGWNLFLDNVGDPNGVESFSAIRFRATATTTIRALDYAITLDIWQHVGVVFGATPALYLNGVEVSSYKAYAAGSGTPSTDVGKDLIIGNRHDLGRGFDGLIEDSRMYEAILSAEEMQAIYMGRGHDQIMRGLLGRWSMNEKAPGVTTSTSPVRDLCNDKNDGVSLNTDTEYAEGIIAMRRTA